MKKALCRFTWGLLVGIIFDDALVALKRAVSVRFEVDLQYLPQ